jgi:hypothetical protein
LADNIVFMRSMIALFACAVIAAAGSDTPPEGPPWERDLLVAQKRALKEGKPLFVYFTKTY